VSGIVFRGLGRRCLGGFRLGLCYRFRLHNRFGLHNGLGFHNGLRNYLVMPDLIGHLCYTYLDVSEVYLFFFGLYRGSLEGGHSFFKSFYLLFEARYLFLKLF
jgi:hypothetical protein